MYANPVGGFLHGIDAGLGCSGYKPLGGRGSGGKVLEGLGQRRSLDRWNFAQPLRDTHLQKLGVAPGGPDRDAPPEAESAGEFQWYRGCTAAPCSSWGERFLEHETKALKYLIRQIEARRLSDHGGSTAAVGNLFIFSLIL